MPRFTSKPTGPAQGTMNIRDDGRRRWGDPAGETPPFDEIMVTDLALLRDTEKEVQKRMG